MRSIALCVLLSFFASAATAKTITSSQGNANDKSVAGVAGTSVAARNSGPQAQTSTQPNRKSLKKSKVKTPPPLHDPN